MPHIGATSLRWRTISAKALSRASLRPVPSTLAIFLRSLSLHLVLTCPLSCRASSQVLSALLLVGAGLISWVPHVTTGIEWALRVGLHCGQQAPSHLDEQGGGSADFTMQRGSKKALMVLRVPLSAFSQGTALTLQQVAGMGLRLREPWNGERVKTSLVSLFKRCGWPSHGVRDGGSDRKPGIVHPLREAPPRASGISAVPHVLATTRKPS